MNKKLVGKKKGIVMKKEHKKMLDDLKEFHAGNHNTNHRKIKVGAQERAISGIKKMSIKRLCKQ